MQSKRYLDSRISSISLNLFDAELVREFDPFGLRLTLTFRFNLRMAVSGFLFSVQAYLVCYLRLSYSADRQDLARFPSVSYPVQPLLDNLCCTLIARLNFC